MARDRDRQTREGTFRAPGAPDPSGKDPIGKLDAVLATLEEMLDEREAPAAGRLPDDGAPGQDPLSVLEDVPVLEDVAVPAPGGDAPRSKAAAPRPEDPPLDARPRPGFDGASDEDDDRARFGDLRLVAGAHRAASPDRERYGSASPPVLEPEAYRHLVDRLVNEIDVIVQTETENELRRVATDIADKVRDHVAIVLPEVLLELVRMSNRPPD